MLSYSLIGIIINYFVLLLIIIYAICVIGHSQQWWMLDIFGKNWAQDGFCLSFKTTMYHTHLLCFYFDTFFAMVLFILSKYTNNRPELNDVQKNIASVFFHGTAHAFLWYLDSIGVEMKPDASIYVVIIPFYFSFIHLMTESPLWFSVFQTLFHSYVTAAVPQILVFTYVNTVLTFNITLNGLLTDKRDIFFALRALMIGLPITVISFIEPIFCDSFLIDWGGHIIFDSSIPIAVICYFVVASQLPPRELQTEKTKSL